MEINLLTVLSYSNQTTQGEKSIFLHFLISSVCVLNLPGTIYKENMSEEIEELRDQIGRKLDIFILTSSTLLLLSSSSHLQPHCDPDKQLQLTD